MGVVAAANAADFVVDARNDRPVPPPATAPPDRLSGLALFQCLLLGRRGAPAGALLPAPPPSPVRDPPGGCGAARSGTAARRTALRGAEQTAGDRPERGAFALA